MRGSYKIGWGNSGALGSVVAPNGEVFSKAGWVVVDSSYNASSTLTNYPNLVVLNMRNFGDSSGTNHFAEMQSNGYDLRFYKKSDNSYVPHARLYFSQSSRICSVYVKATNQDAAFDTLRMFWGGNAFTADSSNFDTANGGVFPFGDDFTSSYNTLPTKTVADFRTLSVVSPYETVALDSVNAPKYWRVIGGASDILYTPTDVNWPYKIFFHSTATNASNVIDSCRISVARSATKTASNWTKYSTPVYNIPASSAYGYRFPQAVVKGDSVFLFFEFDSTSTGRDGIYVSATLATACTTSAVFTDKTLIWQIANGGTPSGWDSAYVGRPVPYYDSARDKWYCFYQGRGVSSKDRIGLIKTGSNPRTGWARYDGATHAPFLDSNVGGTGAGIADSGSVKPCAVVSYGSTYYLSYEGKDTYNATGHGGLYRSLAPVGSSSIDSVSFSRYDGGLNTGELNSIYSRAIFSFTQDGTGDGGVLWQANGSTDRALFKFSFADTVGGQLPSKWNLEQHGIQFSSSATNDTTKTFARAYDSSGVLILNPVKQTAHPIRASGVAGIYSAQDSFTSDIAVGWRSKHINYNSPSGANFYFMAGLGSGTAGDLATGAVSDVSEATNWYESAKDSGICFELKDSAKVGSLVGSRLGYSNGGAYSNAVSSYYQNATTPNINYSVYELTYPARYTGDSLDLVWQNNRPIIQNGNFLRAANITESKRVFFFQGGDPEGHAATTYLDWVYVRPMNYKGNEPLTFIINDTSRSWRDTTIILTYSNCTIKDTRIIGVTADRDKNEGATTSLNGPGRSQLGEEFRILHYYDFLPIIPKNMRMIAVVDDVYVSAVVIQASASDPDTLRINAQRLTEPWVAGTANSVKQVGSVSWICKGSGTAVDGSTIATNDSAWATNQNLTTGVNGVNGGSYYRKLDWSVRSPNITAGTFMPVVVTDIIDDCVQKNQNFGWEITDVSVQPAGAGKYVYLTLVAVDNATTAQRPMLVIHAKYQP